MKPMSTKTEVRNYSVATIVTNSVSSTVTLSAFSLWQAPLSSIPSLKSMIPLALTLLMLSYHTKKPSPLRVPEINCLELQCSPTLPPKVLNLLMFEKDSRPIYSMPLVSTSTKIITVDLRHYNYLMSRKFVN